MWINEPDVEYSFIADCSNAGFGVITSNEPIQIADPVLFVDTIINAPNENPSSTSEVSQYLYNLGIDNCSNYECLQTNLNNCELLIHSCIHQMKG